LETGIEPFPDAVGGAYPGGEKPLRLCMSTLIREELGATEPVSYGPEEMACGSEEFESPPFPFPPPGASGGGAGSPLAAGRLPASAADAYGSQPPRWARRWHASRWRLPPQEGFQTAPLKPPLCIPPLQGSLMACGARKTSFFFCWTRTAVSDGTTVPANQVQGLRVQRREKRLHKKLDTTALGTHARRPPTTGSPGNSIRA
jgi:hypothetical protein